MRAFGDNILVKPIIEENVSESGLKLPERYNPVKGFVIDGPLDLLGCVIYYNRLSSIILNNELIVVPKSSVHCYEEKV